MHKALKMGTTALVLAAMLLCSCTNEKVTQTGNTSVIDGQSIAHTLFVPEESLPQSETSTEAATSAAETPNNQEAIPTDKTIPDTDNEQQVPQDTEKSEIQEQTTLIIAETTATAPEPEEIAPEPPDRFAALGIPEDVGYSYYTEEMREQMLEHGIDYATVESLIDGGYIFSEMLEMSHEERKARSFTRRHTYFDGSVEELLEQLPQMVEYITENYPEIVEKQQYGSSVQGRSLDAYFLSNSEKPKQTIMLTFAMHGYEGDFKNDGAYLTESAYELMLFYAENPEFLAETQLIFCPMLNPDGVYAAKNAKYGREQSEGIDMNRDFKQGRFEAVESRALRDFMQEVEPDILIDFHGWLNATYGDSSLAKIFNKHARLYHWDKQYGSSQGYLIGYAHKQGIQAMLVEHEHFTEINTLGIIYALNEICRNTE